MPSSRIDSSQISILNRLLRPESPTLSRAGARDILSLDFDQVDKERMRELCVKASAGTLSDEENAEADRYELVGHLLSILQSKARRTLKSGHPYNSPSSRSR